MSGVYTPSAVNSQAQSGGDPEVCRDSLAPAPALGRQICLLLNHGLLLKFSEKSAAAQEEFFQLFPIFKKTVSRIEEVGPGSLVCGGQGIGFPHPASVTCCTQNLQPWLSPEGLLQGQGARGLGGRPALAVYGRPMVSDALAGGLGRIL